MQILFLVFACFLSADRPCSFIFMLTILNVLITFLYVSIKIILLIVYSRAELNYTSSLNRYGMYFIGVGITLGNISGRKTTKSQLIVRSKAGNRKLNL